MSKTLALWFAIGLAWLAAAFVILPIAAVVGVCWIAYTVWLAWWRSPAARRWRGHRRAELLFQEVCAIHRGVALPGAEEFATGVAAAIGGASVEALRQCARALYEGEGFDAVPNPPPTEAGELAIARYCDRVSRLMGKISESDAVDLARETMTGSLRSLRKRLPEEARTEPVASAGSLQVHVRIVDAIDDVPTVVEELIAPFYKDRVAARGLFSGLREQLDRNRHEMSGVPFTPLTINSADLIPPTKHRGTSEEIVRGYLRDTPLERLLLDAVPFDIPDQTRFEHQVIFAGSGHGKSQALQYLIAQDLERVSLGKASVIVIDSQGDLVRNIAGLKAFAPGERLHNRLCIIDPTDIEFPVALNLFDAGMERISAYSQLDRERLTNGILELYDFTLGSLLSAELTQKQSVIFRYITRLMLHIPSSTIHTFRELMEPGGDRKYRPYIERLQGTARAFFETEFNSREFADTKRQVVRRLWGILENQTFERMFSHPKNKLDLFTEMNAGKVILINTAKELLKQNGTEIFGRFFIALIAQVAQERAVLPKSARMPAVVYIDEAADYWDENIALILEQARKFNVGLVLAAQYVGQASQKLEESLSANTSIKFAGGVSEKDARTLGRMMRCSPDFIDAQPKGSFAVSIRNVFSSAVSVRIPFGFLEALPRMTKAEFDDVREENRRRYANPLAAEHVTDIHASAAHPQDNDPTAAGTW